MKTCTLLTFGLLATGLLAGCDSGPKSGKGFVFPVGDAARGRAAFVELKCCNCHTVAGVDGLPAPTVAPEKVLALGGDVVRLRTYGNLVTSVIHPSYELSDKYTGPRGPEQMLDLVTFLHPRYKRLEPLYELSYGP